MFAFKLLMNYLLKKEGVTWPNETIKIRTKHEPSTANVNKLVIVLLLNLNESLYPKFSHIKSFGSGALSIYKFFP